VDKTRVIVTAKTVIRRYAPDSVSFADAQPSSLAEIAKGDQVRLRGDKSEDGKTVTADDVVFGTFLTKMGSIVSVNAAGRTVRIQDLTSRNELTVKLNAGSQVKMLPDVKAMFAAMLTAGGSAPHDAGVPHPGESGFDMARMIGQLPAGKIEDLKAGSTIIVTSTAGARSDEVTAILLMANADGLIQVARRAKGDEGMSATEAISSLHGGMLSGPAGLSIPTIIP
jgi:hypothetical protein